jgi:uncharacterized protein (DUF2252 family)
MAEDLASSPVSGLRVQACGDAHLLNFGIYATPERRLVFDVSDFDETLPAPLEWDVKRLAAAWSWRRARAGLRRIPASVQRVRQPRRTGPGSRS